MGEYLEILQKQDGHDAQKQVARALEEVAAAREAHAKFAEYQQLAPEGELQEAADARPADGAQRDAVCTTVADAEHADWANSANTDSAADAKYSGHSSSQNRASFGPAARKYRTAAAGAGAAGAEAPEEAAAVAVQLDRKDNCAIAKDI